MMNREQQDEREGESWSFTGDGAVFVVCFVIALLLLSGAVPGLLRAVQ